MALQTEGGIGLAHAAAIIRDLGLKRPIYAQTAAYGDIPVAAFGIVKKIDMLPLNVGMGLCQGMMPLVAYNYSSGKTLRGVYC